MPELDKKCWRNDAYAKVTGKAKFTDDLKFANVLHAAPAYSDFVHARIVSIDTSAAEKVSGVVRVLTAKDVPGVNRFGQIIRDFRIFADDKIRYHGDVVAVVVAETREIAIRAAQLVKVNAEPLPAVLDPEAAMLPGAPLVHENHGTNIVNTHVVRRGNVEAGFRQADFVIEEKFQTQTVEHAYMETEAAVCVPRSTDGVIEVYGSMQHPFSTRRFVAACLGVALSEVEVIGTPMGGGFGGKDDTAAIVCARTALAAKLLNRPVKMVYRRDWSMRESYKRHPYRVQYKMGVTKAGRITAVQCRIVADGGAYCSVTPWVTWRSTVQCCGPYVVENVHCDTFGVYTNNVVAGAMRGFGSPQMNFVIEQCRGNGGAEGRISGIEVNGARACNAAGLTSCENVHCDTFGVYTNNVVTGAMRGFGSPQMNFVIEQMVEMRRSGSAFRELNSAAATWCARAASPSPGKSSTATRSRWNRRSTPCCAKLITKRNSRDVRTAKAMPTNFTASAWR